MVAPWAIERTPKKHLTYNGLSFISRVAILKTAAKDIKLTYMKKQPDGIPLWALELIARRRQLKLY